MANKNFSEDQMREFSKEVIPAVNKLREIAERHGITEGLRVYVSNEYLSVEGAGLGGWELHKFGDRYELKYEKRIPIHDSFDDSDAEGGDEE